MESHTPALALAALAALPAVLHAQDAQEPAQGQKQDDQKNAKLAREIDDLNERVDALEDELAKERLARSQVPQSAAAFNPAITVFGNFFARWDDQPVFLDDDPSAERVDDQMNLREAEIDFRAAIDPWADGVLIASFESEVPNEFTSEIEEGYIVLKKLPILDTAPSGLKLKVGRFRPEFGRFNYIHQHDLPQPTYPRALTTFFGADGLIQNGVSGQFFVPVTGEKSTLEATLQVLDGGDAPLVANLETQDISTLGHLKGFRDLTDSTNVEAGVSGYEGDSDHQLYGLDASYKWKPLAGGEWRSFLIGGELFASHVDDPTLGDDPQGWYLWSQYQFDKNLYLGARYDHAEVLTDASESTDVIGTYLTYYTTEFLRFRLALEHTESDVPELDGLNTAALEINMVFGSHPVEPYWVNR
jgi:hypothetical protein